MLSRKKCPIFRAYLNTVILLCHFTIFVKNILPFDLIHISNFFIATSLLLNLFGGAD